MAGETAGKIAEDGGRAVTVIAAATATAIAAAEAVTLMTTTMMAIVAYRGWAEKHGYHPNPLNS